MKIISVTTTVIYLILITTLSLVRFSDEIEPPKIEHFDKFVHFCFYFGLNILLLYTFLQFKKELIVRYIAFPTLLSIAYSIAIELLQPLTGRTCDLVDVVANSIGAMTGAMTFIVLWPKLSRFGKS